MSGGYYDIDSILCSEERVPCTFDVQAVGVGHLDPTVDDEDLAEGSKVELPLWLARPLYDNRMVSVELPKQYNMRFREHLAAGPGAINLREKGPYYYEVGGMLADMMGDLRLTDMLLVLFSGERFRSVLDQSLNSRDVDATPFTRTLPNAEGRLYLVGYHTSDEYMQWKTRQQTILGMSKVLQGKSKRRRV